MAGTWPRRAGTALVMADNPFAKFFPKRQPVESASAAVNFCTNCGSPVGDWRFCSNCGAPLRTSGYERRQPYDAYAQQEPYDGSPDLYYEREEPYGWRERRYEPPEHARRQPYDTYPREEPYRPPALYAPPDAFTRRPSASLPDAYRESPALSSAPLLASLLARPLLDGLGGFGRACVHPTRTLQSAAGSRAAHVQIDTRGCRSQPMPDPADLCARRCRLEESRSDADTLLLQAESACRADPRVRALLGDDMCAAPQPQSRHPVM